MKNDNLNDGSVGTLKTAIEITQAESDTSLTDHLFRVIHQTAGQKIFRPEYAVRPTIYSEATFIDYAQFEPGISAEVAALGREHFAKEFPDIPFPESGWLTQDVNGLISGEELDKLRASQAAMEKIVTEMEPFATTKINERMFAMRDAQAAAISAGEAVAQLLPSRETVLHDSMQRLSAYNAVLLKICHEDVVPVCRQVFIRFEAILTKFLQRTEKQDRVACYIKGQGFEPSLDWRCAAVIAQRYTAAARLPKPHAHGTPKQILQNIVEI